MSLYANKGCTDQIRKIQKISIEIVSREKIDELYIVTAKAIDHSGRYDESTAAIQMKGLTGEDLCNALMKCETKAKRRVTLSLTGLGMMDETEIQTIPDARRIEVNQSTGEIIDENSALSNKQKKAIDELMGKLDLIQPKIDTIVENLKPGGNMSKAGLAWFGLTDNE